MKQTTIDGEPLSQTDHITHTCGECEHLFKSGKWYKCPIKPRGFGYDIRLKHPACIQFKDRVTPMKLYGRRV
jgi:hypothetical protein